MHSQKSRSSICLSVIPQVLWYVWLKWKPIKKFCFVRLVAFITFIRLLIRPAKTGETSTFVKLAGNFSVSATFPAFWEFWSKTTPTRCRKPWQYKMVTGENVSLTRPSENSPQAIEYWLLYIWTRSNQWLLWGAIVFVYRNLTLSQNVALWATETPFRQRTHFTSHRSGWTLLAASIK